MYNYKENDLAAHALLITASQAVGKTTIRGIAKDSNIYPTVQALRLMGVKITENEDLYTIHGVGVGGLVAPKNVLDVGNSDISAHLLIGLLSTYSFTSFFTGNIDLRSKPISETIKALSSMCVGFIANNNSFPIAVVGSDSTIPISYTLTIPSAEIKSAILFAALNTAGKTTITEVKSTNNCTETILKRFGANLNISKDMNGHNIIAIHGREELLAQEKSLDI
ncbi:MAG: hypothetical protein sL5_05730 [Candidatus Mesenet longicola]|uniref:Enolpyruvate transferase domain-containing protein n=1 Tax=Candidatus Mesenet longicola TaxID=1892558 RepID=A0A8J3HUZ3_9RICK|nr:MAG: hypothetical protein sGL2_06000 [Candidatus Mesenet longicola]GHM59580.1 MAG: hypothetical protein sL5_05730 [Candidatus Mesenet longicola]